MTAIEIEDINSKEIYSYEDMKEDIERLERGFAEIVSAGILSATADDNNIYCIRLGNASASTKIMIQSSMHGREWLNTKMIIKSIEYYCDNYYTEAYEGVTFERLFRSTCFYILPMVNPDGIYISQYGTYGVKSDIIRRNVESIGTADYHLWKANARGVDINRNFGYGFGFNKMIRKPSPAYYAGDKPYSENETKALVSLVNDIKPEAVINYHETGKIIYYSRRTPVLDAAVKTTGYEAICDKSEPDGSFGSYLDANDIMWCTIETCDGDAPVGNEQYKDLYDKNRDIMAAVAKLVTIQNTREKLVFSS